MGNERNKDSRLRARPVGVAARVQEIFKAPIGTLPDGLAVAIGRLGTVAEPDGEIYRALSLQHALGAEAKEMAVTTQGDSSADQDASAYNWKYKHTHWYRSKLWIDVDAKVMLLAEDFGRNKRIFRWSQIKGGGTRAANSGIPYDHLELIVRDADKPIYIIRFSDWKTVVEWFHRIEVLLNWDRY